MADFTIFRLDYNTNTDASPTWTNTAIAFGGSGGANEIRFVNGGLGATGATGSAAWPLVTKPSSGTAVYTQAWAFPADTTGLQTTYTGDNLTARVFRWEYDNLGTFASSPQLSSFDSTAHNTPSPGTQPSFINGSADTSNTSYLKGNAYGRGTQPSGSAQDTPPAGSIGSVGSNPAATTGTAGSVSPPTTPAWLTTWQSLQGWTQYIVNAGTPQATFAGFWYFVLALFYGANISAATYTWVLTMQYTFS